MTRERLIGLMTGAAALLLTLYAVYGDAKAPQNQKDSVWQVAIFSLIVTAVAFGVLLPWAMKRVPGKAGLIVSILGVVSLAAFWSGLPVVLGSAGATLGMVGREGAVERRGRATAAVIVGVGAVVVAIGVTLLTNAVLH
ncbi:MAG TPA: hypothetical protein VHA53_02635 [Nitrolancea sp.]|jgi:hypothetical protein|nr:hypothetical protein [Nitrolancea sp.]